MSELSEEEIIVKIQEIIDYQNLSTEIGFIDQSDSVKAIHRFIRPIPKRKRKE